MDFLPQQLHFVVITILYSFVLVNVHEAHNFKPLWFPQYITGTEMHLYCKCIKIQSYICLATEQISVYSR